MSLCVTFTWVQIIMFIVTLKIDSVCRQSERSKTSQRPWWKDNGTLVLCPSQTGQVSLSEPGDSAWHESRLWFLGTWFHPPGLSWSVPRQLCLRHPRFSLPTLSDLAFCWPWLVSLCNSIYDVLLKKLAWPKSSVYARPSGSRYYLYYYSLFLIFFIPQPQLSYSTLCHLESLFLWIQVSH